MLMGFCCIYISRFVCLKKKLGCVMLLIRRSRFVKKSITALILLTIVYLLINLKGNVLNRSVSRSETKSVTRGLIDGGQYPAKHHMEYMDFQKSDMVDEHKKPYKIIIWTQESGTPIFRANPHICKANISCEVTFDETDQNSAHAIVLKSDSIKEDHLPKNRKPSQLYAWWSSESPVHTKLHENLDSYFNLTFHYRRDADVYAPYGTINLILRELSSTGDTNLEALLEKKRDKNLMVAWAVSNCYLKRYLYGRSLILLGLKVDTFGRCFNFRELGEGRFSKQFIDRLSEYKFYFAFENSIHCKDYITEKFWFNSLRAGTVPVVWGPRKEDLLKVVPEKSFIHADDYKNPEDLVKYLNYLANNETAYAEYLQWRTWAMRPERVESRLRLENQNYDLRSFCKLCSILQVEGKRRKSGLPMRNWSVPSLREAWVGREENKCYM